MSDGMIRVTYAAVNEAAANCASTSSWMEGRLDQLESELGPLRQTFTGQEAQAYEQVQQKWNTAVSDMKQVLMNLSKALSQAAEDFQRMDQQGAARWGG